MSIQPAITTFKTSLVAALDQIAVAAQDTGFNTTDLEAAIDKLKDSLVSSNRSLELKAGALKLALDTLQFDVNSLPTGSNILNVTVDNNTIELPFSNGIDTYGLIQNPSAITIESPMSLDLRGVFVVGEKSLSKYTFECPNDEGEMKPHLTHFRFYYTSELYGELDFDKLTTVITTGDVSNSALKWIQDITVIYNGGEISRPDSYNVSSVLRLFYEP